MNSTQASGFALALSACLILAALVVTMNQKGQTLEPRAEAEMVLTANGLSFLTTRTNAGEEALFVLDNTSARLLIYKTDLAKKRIELVATEDLKRLFELAAAEAPGNGNDKLARNPR
ncbi:MAG: hypothetical protein WD768_08135 [Phycisphaeraceae bacterium]